ncbi:flagella basal body P-ring formation protein FlgA [Persephonella hydrogeniphila]|uniref:Flagella basal body P-ring formation protein FlgA n=1 Tax=Persephonella hydrogeniphila TaxID=198703 RepID=A0A285NF90_9AQUI|nr:flagellar basal body P-ring formation chaperone FlgA [Persephonella hydrogeniphila]SNZ08130.1 flagella basal body P-ring formation protein FlgA [Persephonella hydrogeniphila]
MRCSEPSVPSKVKILLIFLLLFSPVYSKTVIKLKSYVETEKSKLTLSDISVINTDNERFLTFLSGITVIEGLKAGEEKELRKNQILKILKNNYVNPDSVVIKGEKVKIKRKEIILSPEIIKEKITEYLKRYPDIQIEDIRVSLKTEKLNKPFTLKIEERSKSNRYIYLSVYILQNGKKIRKLNATVKYQKVADVIVAKKDLLRGELITEDDIELKKLPVKNNYITDPDLVIGAKVRTLIKKGSPLKLTMIEPDYPVKRKSYVKVIYDRNGIKIEITGIALENGQKGQVIKVKNSSTGKILSCKVIGKDTVLFIGGY